MSEVTEILKEIEKALKIGRPINFHVAGVTPLGDWERHILERVQSLLTLNVVISEKEIKKMQVDSYDCNNIMVVPASSLLSRLSTKDKPFASCQEHGDLKENETSWDGQCLRCEAE